jgi:hypothetical protein
MKSNRYIDGTLQSENGIWRATNSASASQYLLRSAVTLRDHFLNQLDHTCLAKKIFIDWITLHFPNDHVCQRRKHNSWRQQDKGK